MSEKRQAASWVADEYGGSYLNNPQQQNRDLAAAHDMAILIQRTVQNKGGDYQRTGELINETLRELSGRAPFGFVTPAFALGTTQVLLDRANQMSGPQFVQYLEGIKDRDNPLFFWQRTTLDPLMEEVKGRTRAHVEEIYGRSTFAVFEGMKGQNGPLAFGAGAADALLEEVGGGGRGLLLSASNPVEAGRQAVDMARNLDRVPQALQQQVNGARELIAASSLDDYHKGFLTARVAIIALDAADVVETGMSLTNLSRQLRNGNVDTIGDAMRALDEGPQAMRRGNGDSPDVGADTAGRAAPQYRSTTLRDVGDAAVAGLPAERQPAYRQALDEALQARGIADPERAQKFVADLNGAPDGATMQGIHRRAGELIYGRPTQTVSDIVNASVGSVPDNVEWAYQRAMQRTLREQGIDTPEGAQRYIRDLAGNPNGAAAQTLQQRAYAEVLDNAVKPLPINAQDYYRRAIDGLAREKGHDSISEVQTYLGNLNGAPNGQSMQAVHNRAYGLLMDDTLQSLPANARPLYREALNEILQERDMNTVSSARGYIDRLSGAPNGQSMQALHNRAYDAMLDNTLGNIPESAHPAYRQTLGQIFQERGLTTLSTQQTYIDNLIAAPTGPSMQAVHNRAFGTVVDNAVNAMPEAQRPAYRQALREQFSASGVDTVAEAQRYVVDLANSPQTLAKLHDRADAILNPSRTPPVAAAPNPAQTPDLSSNGTPGNVTPNTGTPSTGTSTNSTSTNSTPENPAPSANTSNTSPGNNGTVNGGVQSIVGDDNVQIGIDEARINGERRQTVTDGDNNRQTQNLGRNVTAESMTQTIDGRADSRQQIGNADDGGRELTPTDDRKMIPIFSSSDLNGQSVAYTPRFSTQHDLTGDGAGAYTTISGHGVLEADSVLPRLGNSVQRDTFVVPEGVNLHFLGLPGGVITDRLGQRADIGGDLSGVPLLKLGAGDTAPDILITPSFGTINIMGNPITVDNPQGVRLSQLIRDHDLSGNIVVSTCLQQSVSQGKKENWQGISFDLPARYPNHWPPAPAVSKPSPEPSSQPSPEPSSQPLSFPIDPNFNTQHGLTGNTDGRYTAIGGHAALSGEHPYLKTQILDQSFTVPEGVTVYFSALPGGTVSNKLAEAIEKGQDLSQIPLLKVNAGATAPDPLLLPGNYEVAGNFIIINNPEGRRLSEVIEERGLTGDIVVAGGLEGRGQTHSGVTFYLPEQYPTFGSRNGTRSLDLSVEQVLGLPARTLSPPQEPTREQTPQANDGRQSSLPDPVVPVSGRGDPGLDDPRNPNHAMFASALDRIQTFERDRGIDSGDFARNLAGDLTVRSVEAGLPRINHVVFNAEGTRAFAVDTPNLDAEWRRVAYTDVAGAGQQALAASSERLRELQPQAQQQMSVQQDAPQRPDEQARASRTV